MHHVLIYDYVEGYLEKRVPLRDEHLGLAKGAVERGELALAGVLADPVDGALLVFRGDDPAPAERFAAADPYVREGLVASWRIRPWQLALGEI